MILGFLAEHDLPFTLTPHLVKLTQTLAKDPKPLNETKMDRCAEIVVEHLESFQVIKADESNNQKVLSREETSFREFINKTLAEEDPDELEDRILEYVNAKDSVTDNGEARNIKPKKLTDKSLQQKSASETGHKLLEKVRSSQQKVSKESDDSEADSQVSDNQEETENVDVNSKVKNVKVVKSLQKAACTTTSTPDDELKRSDDELKRSDDELKRLNTTSDVQYVTFDQMEDILEKYVKKSEFRRFKKRFENQEPINEMEAELEKIITAQKGAFEAVDAGLKHFFTIEEIKNHSATGKKANKDHAVKPKFDPVKFNMMSKLVQKHFDISHKEVVIKTQNVKRKYSK